MKHKSKKYSKSNDTRQDWKDTAESEIINMQDQLDEMADEFGLSEAAILKIEKIVSLFKDGLNEQIDEFKIDANMVFAQDDLFEDCVDEIYYNRQVATEYTVDKMIDITSQNKSGQFVEIGSLAEQIKLDEFLAEMAENPYQLKLIA